MDDVTAGAQRSLMTSFDPGQQSPATELEEAENQLKIEIEEQWLKLNKLQAKLNQEKKIGKINNPECTMSQISEAKEKRLQAEIDANIKTSPSLLSTNSEVIEAVLLSDLQTCVEQLKQTLSVVKTQRRELVEETERERRLLKQHKEVKASIEEKIEVEQKIPEKSHDSELKNWEEMKKRWIEKQKNLMKNLGQFAKQHFPMPNIPDSKRKRHLSGKTVDDDDELFQLFEILEVLMNKSTGEDKHDPYVQVTSNFWPPYVELLLRCGIARRHPEDSNRIALTSYHM
ncbi:centromere protein K-like [Antedon mediterranea]|uniref:centromere protein K-like n=1 Tax=Antedon mediterranea TaxID=105859 RepID=UPI003AF49A72